MKPTILSSRSKIWEYTRKLTCEREKEQVNKGLALVVLSFIRHTGSIDLHRRVDQPREPEAGVEPDGSGDNEEGI